MKKLVLFPICVSFCRAVLLLDMPSSVESLLLLLLFSYSTSFQYYYSRLPPSLAQMDNRSYTVRNVPYFRNGKGFGLRVGVRKVGLHYLEDAGILEGWSRALALGFRIGVVRDESFSLGVGSCNCKKASWRGVQFGATLKTCP